MQADVSAAALEREVVRLLMPRHLGALWVREYCSPQLKRAAAVICERVRQAAIEQVRRTSWLSASTRDVAVYKLQRLNIEVGWPDIWLLDSPATLHAKMSFVDALQALAGAATDRDLALLRSGDCRAPTGEDWGSPVFEVNAFYYPAENRFLLPAGILRPPFYDERKSAVWNYGAIGATIGHELCHAFDAEGRNYDADGRQRNWWTAGDRREYDARAKRMVELYESEEYRGLAVNGRLTLVENIADIGGLEFALAGARAALGRALTKDELREFFYAFAYSWRSKDRIQTAAEKLVTDTHAPPMLRVNHTLRQMDEWYEAYDVSADCAAFVPPAKRVRFFR
jgi:putative endopeptidase